MGIPWTHPAVVQAIAKGLIPPPVAVPGGRATKAPMAPPAALPWSLTVAVPVRVLSEANRRDHWAASHRRAKAQRDAVRAALARFAVPASTPVRVGIVRIHGNKDMDGDNLQRACKAIRDEIAAWLGVDDGSDVVAFDYGQERGPPAVRITVRGGDAPGG